MAFVVCVTLVQSLFVGSLCTIHVSRQLAAHRLICLDASSLESPSSACPCTFCAPHTRKPLLICISAPELRAEPGLWERLGSLVKEGERFRCWDGFGIQNGWAGEPRVSEERCSRQRYQMAQWLKRRQMWPACPSPLGEDPNVLSWLQFMLEYLSWAT